MAGMTLFAQPMAMATTQLAYVVQYDAASPSQFDGNVERSRALHMSWVVVTDGEGKPQLCMRWASDCC
jgi:hypothetical protein